VPEDHWDPAGKIKDEAKYADWVNQNAAAVAAERSRKLTLPQKPDDYKAEFTTAFKPPEGLGDPSKPLHGVMDPADPLIAQYRALAHKRGLDQETFSEGLDMIAALRVNEQTQIKAAYTAEMAKLGTAAPDRIDAVVQWVNAIAGPDAAALGTAMKMAPVAGTVIAFEKIMQRFQSQGVTPFSQAHRADAPDAGKIPGYDKMTFEQRRHAQELRRAGAR
jgi:hypothetical protein